MSVARIPFSDHQEGVLRSAARWMRIVALFQLISGGIGLVVVTIMGLMATTLFAVMNKLGDAKFQVDAPEWIVGGVVTLMILAIVATMWAAMALLRASDRFTAVANSDTDDANFLAEGLAALSRFFLVEAVASVLGASAVIFAQTFTQILS